MMVTTTATHQRSSTRTPADGLQWGGLASTKGTARAPHRPNLQFDILHPVTSVTDLRRHRCDLAGGGVKLPPATLATGDG